MASGRLFWMIAACGALGVTGCGGSESSDSSDDAGAETAAKETPRTAQQALPGAAPATNAGDEAPEREQIAFDDSSPQAAMDTYMTRLAAGDLSGAAEVCVEGSPGRAALEKTAQGLENAVADGMDRATMESMLVGDIRAMTWEAVETGDGVVVFEVTSPAANAPTRIEARDMGGFWRVNPPAQGGLPG